MSRPLGSSQWLWEGFARFLEGPQLAYQNKQVGAWATEGLERTRAFGLSFARLPQE